MTKTGVLLVAIAAACAVWVAPSAGKPAACDPGEKVVKGISLFVYCGPARATLKVGGKAYKVFGGKCRLLPESKLYVVDVGIHTIAGGKPTARYLGIRSLRLTSGATKTASVAVQVARKMYSLAPSVVKIGKGMRSGTFTGDALGPAGRVSGTWNC